METNRLKHQEKQIEVCFPARKTDSGIVENCHGKFEEEWTQNQMKTKPTQIHLLVWSYLEISNFFQIHFFAYFLTQATSVLSSQNATLNLFYNVRFPTIAVTIFESLNLWLLSAWLKQDMM